MQSALLKIAGGTSVGAAAGMIASIALRWNVIAGAILFTVSGCLASFVWIVVQAYEDRMEKQRAAGRTPSAVMEITFYIVVCLVGLIILSALVAAFLVFVTAKH